MRKESRREFIERALKDCPTSLKATDVPAWIPVSKNYVYALINSGRLRSFKRPQKRIILKDDLIQFMLDNADSKYKALRVPPDKEDEL